MKGGKNDKDACRDVMKTKCGNEIDTELYNARDKMKKIKNLLTHKKDCFTLSIDSRLYAWNMR